MGWSQGRLPRRRALGALLSVLIAGLASSQARTWSGEAQCQVQVQGSGYSHHETHIWKLSGGAPTQQGAMKIYAGTWSVTGGGSLEKTQGTQTLRAQWTTNASLTNAPFAVLVRASDGKLLLKSWHAQLRAKNSVNGSQQLFFNGVPQPEGAISLEAFEWSFPAVEGAGASTSLSGAKTTATNGAVGPMQPGGSQGTAACSWRFGK